MRPRKSSVGSRPVRRSRSMTSAARRRIAGTCLRSWERAPSRASRRFLEDQAHGERRRARGRSGGPRQPADGPSRRPRPSREQERLRAGRVWIVLGHHGRRPRVRVPRARRGRSRTERSDRRVPHRWRSASSDPAGIRGRGCGAMRVLHAGAHRGDVLAAQTEPRAERTGSTRSALREYLPLHRLRENTRGRGSRIERDVPPMRSAAPRTRVRGGVGESVERPDSAPKVKGEFQYGSDLRREGMLFGATLRSTHAHARIAGIDAASAKKMSGVKAIITSAELPTRELFGLMKLDQPVLASGKVRYVGEPVAIVAAETAEEARPAARAIAVRYEPLAPITDPVPALQPNAAKLHLKENGIEDGLPEPVEP